MSWLLLLVSANCQWYFVYLSRRQYSKLTTEKPLPIFSGMCFYCDGKIISRNNQCANAKNYTVVTLAERGNEALKQLKMYTQYFIINRILVLITFIAIVVLFNFCVVSFLVLRLLCLTIFKNFSVCHLAFRQKLRTDRK